MSGTILNFEWSRYSHKKNMQILHSLLESQESQAEQLDDQVELLEAALAVAKARDVVKRPIHAPHLGNAKPSFDLRGSVNRFDVYVTQKQLINK
jgi:16S rRNA (guanine1516-N2)-methyltransferase